LPVGVAVLSRIRATTAADPLECRAAATGETTKRREVYSSTGTESQPALRCRAWCPIAALRYARRMPID